MNNVIQSHCIEMPSCTKKFHLLGSISRLSNLFSLPVSWQEWKIGSPAQGSSCGLLSHASGGKSYGVGLVPKSQLHPGQLLGLAFRNQQLWGTWVAQSLKHLTSAQVTIPRFREFKPCVRSVLTARSLEPASDSCLPLSLPLPRLCCLCLSKIYKH